MRVIRNRRARYDYQLGPTLVAGVVLSGREVQAVRQGRASLAGAYVRIRHDELWLVNMQVRFLEYQIGGGDKLQQQGQHKLLVTKRQLRQLQSQQGPRRTLVPLELRAGRYVKLALAVGQGRRRQDKRQLLKQRADRRVIKRRLHAGRDKQ